MTNPAGRDAPRHGHRHVVGAEMHALRADGERHVDPVVDDEGNAHRLQQRPAEFSQFSRGGRLESELHRGDAPLLRRPDQCHEVPPPDERIVGDEHELRAPALD